MSHTTLDVFQPCACCALSGIPLTTHHILPRSAGGTDLSTNVVRVCEDCHGRIHDTAVFSSELVKAGLVKAKARGVTLGAPVKGTPEKAAEVRALRSQGLTVKAIAEAVGLSAGTVHKLCKAS